MADSGVVRSPEPGSPLASLPDRWVSRGHERHILVSNDPRLDPDAVRALQPGWKDTLIQFNGAAHFDALADLRCRRLHVFQGNGEPGNFGFDAEGQPARDWTRQMHTELVLVYTFWKAAKVAAAYVPPPQVVEQVVSPKRHISAWRYPHGRVPSAGFILLSYLRYVNVARHLLQLAELSIVTAGFTGEYPPGGGWHGHDFAHEQVVLRQWGEVTRLGFDGAPLP